jgi:hypothetical protein
MTTTIAARSPGRGCRPAEVVDGGSALVAARTLKPALDLSDVQLPDKDCSSFMTGRPRKHPDFSPERGPEAAAFARRAGVSHVPRQSPLGTTCERLRSGSRDACFDED